MPEQTAKNPWAHRLMAIAIGVALGYGILWTATSVRRAAGISLLDHGREFTIKSDGTVEGLGPVPSALQPAVRKAILFDEIDRPSFWQELQAKENAGVGTSVSESSFHAIEPVDAVVEKDCPVFRWSAKPGANAYRVSVASKAGVFLRSPSLPGTATSWQTDNPIPPNETETWSVEAWRDSTLLAQAPASNEPAAHFRVLDPATRARLEQLRKTSGGAHLLMGVAYAQAGLRADARRELEAFQKENSRSPLPKNLLSSLANW